MTVIQAIETYKKTQYIPRHCHLNWLKENFNPILKEINPSISINWACSNCIQSNMRMLIGWLDREQDQKTNNDVKNKK